MESNLLVAARATIMLGSLVAFPLLAVLGLPLPDEVVALLPRSLRPANAAESPRRGTIAPLFDLPGENVHYRIDVENGMTEPAETAGGAFPATTRSVVQRANFESIDGSAAGVVPASFESGRTTDREVEAVSQRLERLGVVQSRLEPWGTTGLYRFWARVPIGEDPHLCRHFETTGDSPQMAMQQVASEIQQWRSGSSRR